MQKPMASAGVLAVVGLLATACGDLGPGRSSPQPPMPAAKPARSRAARVAAPVQAEARPSVDAESIRALTDELGRLRAQITELQTTKSAPVAAPVERVETVAQQPAAPPAQAPVAAAERAVQTVVERETYVEREVPVFVDRDVPVYVDQEVPVVAACDDPAPLAVWSVTVVHRDGRRDDRGQRPAADRDADHGRQVADVPSVQPTRIPSPPRVVPHRAEHDEVGVPAPVPPDSRAPRAPRDPQAPREAAHDGRGERPQRAERIEHAPPAPVQVPPPSVAAPSREQPVAPPPPPPPPPMKHHKG